MHDIVVELSLQLGFNSNILNAYQQISSMHLSVSQLTSQFVSRSIIDVLRVITFTGLQFNRDDPGNLEVYGTSRFVSCSNIDVVHDITFTGLQLKRDGSGNPLDLSLARINFEIVPVITFTGLQSKRDGSYCTVY